MEVLGVIMSFLYRDHRGSFDDSMRTVQEFESRDDLRKHLEKTYMEVGTIFIKPYWIDNRIDWDTYIVTVDNGVVGFTNGPVPE